MYSPRKVAYRGHIVVTVWDAINACVLHLIYASSLTQSDPLFVSQHCVHTITEADSVEWERKRIGATPVTTSLVDTHIMAFLFMCLCKLRTYIKCLKKMLILNIIIKNLNTVILFFVFLQSSLQ